MVKSEFADVLGAVVPFLVSLPVLFAIHPASFILEDDVAFLVKLDTGALAVCSPFVPKAFMDFSVAFVELSESMRHVVSPFPFVGGPVDSPGHLAFSILHVAYPFSFVYITSLGVNLLVTGLSELGCLGFGKPAVLTAVKLVLKMGLVFLLLILIIA